MKRLTIVAIALASNVAVASPRVALVEQPDEAPGEPLVLIPPGAAPVLQRPPIPPKRYALAVNNPLAWGGFAFGISGYAAITEHQAVRVNMAWFKTANENPGLFLLGSILSGEPIEDEAYYEGGLFDAGVGWMYFPRRVWSGPTIELGAVLRTTHTYYSDEYSSPMAQSIDTTTVAGRTLVGWSWDVRGRVFLSIAAGAAYGHESGTHTDVDGYTFEEMTPTTAPISRWKTSFEWCTRIGATF